MGRRDFRGATIEVFTAPTSAGAFSFAGEFVIPKNPQIIAQKLKLHSLQFKTGHSRNACMLAPAVNDYVLIFHKPGDHPCPVRSLRHASKNPGGWVSTKEWIRDAHGGWWSDIQEIDVLDGATGRGLKKYAEADHEKHVCPLQLEVIRRLVNLYSNPVAVQPDATVLPGPRNVVGFELKESYHRAAVANCRKAAGGAAKAAVRVEARDMYEGVEE